MKRMLPYLMRHDRVVKVLNTKDPSNSHGYNPLKYTRNDLEVLIAVDTIMGNTTGRKPDEGVDRGLLGEIREIGVRVPSSEACAS